MFLFFFSERYGVFFCRSFGEVSIFSMFFCLWSIRPRPLPKHLSDVFYQLRWPHHNFYGRKMHCHDRSVTVSRLVLDGWFWRKPKENDLWCFFRCIPNRNLKHLRTCFESCPKDQRLDPPMEGWMILFFAGVFFDPKKKTVLSSQDS